METQFIYNKETHTLAFNTDKDFTCAKIGDNNYRFHIARTGENALSLLNENIGKTVFFCKTKDGVHIFIHGEKYYLEFPQNKTNFAGAGIAAGQKGLVTSPMPGTIIKLLVKEGEQVRVDQGLVIVEAMKMENEIRSTVDGIVKKIHFRAGDTVNVGQSIIDLEEPEILKPAVDA